MKKINKNYVPTQEELRQFRNMLDRLTPNKEIFYNYDRAAAFYLDIMPEVRHSGKKLFGIAEKIRLLESELFKHKYLLAYADSSWFKDAAPTCDAFVSVVESPGMSRFPIVLVPNNRKLGHTFRSVIEHEFVHINQILIGSESSISRYPEDLVENFFRFLSNEYEAGFLQLISWPKLYPLQLGISLEHWCILRGYSQGLENTLEMIIIDAQLNDVENVLVLIKRRLPEMFKLIGVNEGVLQWFIERFTTHVGIALMNVFEKNHNIQNNKSFIAVARWFRTNYDESSKELYMFVRQTQPILYKVLFENTD